MHFHQTTIYHKALELNCLAKTINDNLPRGMAFLADQLRRAASSIALNFAEGYGKASKHDQKRFYFIARGSVYEVSAILDVAKQWQAISDNHFEQGQALCDHLGGMITKFSRL